MIRQCPFLFGRLELPPGLLLPLITGVQYLLASGSDQTGGVYLKSGQWIPESQKLHNI